jgi:hypothetical protein
MFIGTVGSIVEVIGIDCVAVEQLKTVLLVEFLENRLFDVVFGNEIGHWETAICAARWNLLYLFCPVVEVLRAKFRIIRSLTAINYVRDAVAIWRWCGMYIIIFPI